MHKFTSTLEIKEEELFIEKQTIENCSNIYLSSQQLEDQEKATKRSEKRVLCRWLSNDTCRTYSKAKWNFIVVHFELETSAIFRLRPTIKAQIGIFLLLQRGQSSAKRFCTTINRNAKRKFVSTRLSGRG